MAGRHPPLGRPPTTPAARSPDKACRPRGQCWAPKPTHPRPQHVGGGPQQPAQWAGSRGEGQRLTSDAPHNGGRHPPRGRPSATPTASNTGPQGRTLWGWCRVPTPRTDCTRDTRVAEPCLPAPEDGQPGGYQRLAPGAPHNGGRPSPPGTATHRPRGMQPPQGMQAAGTVLGPHTHTPMPTARGWRTPTARPVGGQSGEGQRLTSDAPHNGERHPPRGRPSATPTASNAGPKGRTLWGQCWVPTPAPTAPGTDGSRNPSCPLQRTGSRGGGQRLTPGAPHNGGRPPPPPGTATNHPHGTQPPQGVQAAGTVLGSHTHTPTPTARGWRTPTARPVGGQSGEGQRLTSDAPHNGGRHPPPGTPFGHPHSEQRRPARAQAVGPALGSHARTDRTRDTRVAEPWLPAPEDGRPGEGQRLTPGAPHNGGRPPPPGTAPHHPRGTQPPQGMQAKGTVLGPHTHTPAPTARGWRIPTDRPVGGQSGEGQRLNSDAPHNGGRHPPRGHPPVTPTASNAGPQGRTL